MKRDQVKESVQEMTRTGVKMALRALDVSAQKRYVLFFPPFSCVVSRRGGFWQFRAAQGVDGVSEKLVGRPEGENVYFLLSHLPGVVVKCNCHISYFVAQSVAQLVPDI